MRFKAKYTRKNAYDINLQIAIMQGVMNLWTALELKKPRETQVKEVRISIGASNQMLGILEKRGSARPLFLIKKFLKNA